MTGEKSSFILQDTYSEFGTHSAFYPVDIGRFCLEDKFASTSSIAEVKNEYNCTSSSPLFVPFWTREAVYILLR